MASFNWLAPTPGQDAASTSIMISIAHAISPNKMVVPGCEYVSTQGLHQLVSAGSHCGNSPRRCPLCPILLLQPGLHHLAPQFGPCGEPEHERQRTWGSACATWICIHAASASASASGLKQPPCQSVGSKARAGLCRVHTMAMRVQHRSASQRNR